MDSACHRWCQAGAPAPIAGGRRTAWYSSQMTGPGTASVGERALPGRGDLVDQTVLNYKGKKRESLLGTASAGPMADGIDTEAWKKFQADYKANFPDGFPSPSLFAYLYYVGTEAALLGLDKVNGDLSNCFGLGI